jgi:hypothetical protein
MTMKAFLPEGPVARDHADTILELVFLVIVVDGHLDPAESAAFRELMCRLHAHVPSDDQVAALYQRFTKELAGSTCIDRVKAVAPRVPPDLREPAFRMALALALIDRDASVKEDALIDVLFHALQLDVERAEALAQEVRVALSPPPEEEPGPS